MNIRTPMSHILSAAKGLVVVAAAVMTLIQPAAAQRGINQVKIDMGGESEYSKSIVLPLNKAAIVNLPSSAADVLVSQDRKAHV